MGHRPSRIRFQMPNMFGICRMPGSAADVAGQGREDGPSISRREATIVLAGSRIDLTTATGLPFRFRGDHLYENGHCNIGRLRLLSLTRSRVHPASRSIFWDNVARR